MASFRNRQSFFGLAFVMVAGLAMNLSAGSTTQPNAPWHLDRIDEVDLPLSGSYTWGKDGAGVTVYVIDAPVRISHEEFEGRAIAGPTFIGEPGPGEPGGPPPPGYWPRGNATNADHGTLVASLVAGHRYGSAKKANIVSIAVKGTSSNTALPTDIARAIDWVTDNRVGPAVINLSFASKVAALNGYWGVMEVAVRRAVAANVTVVGIAGNDGGFNAGEVSPGREPVMITVGATNEADQRAGFSNIGSAIDLFAPGANITGASFAGDSSYVTDEGTSLAGPIVAGLAARYLQAHPTHSPEQVRNALVGIATQNQLSNIGAGSPNLLAFADPNDNPDPPLPPTGRFKFNANGLCYFESSETGPDLCQLGRYKVDGSGWCYWDAADNGPDQMHARRRRNWRWAVPGWFDVDGVICCTRLQQLQLRNAGIQVVRRRLLRALRCGRRQCLRVSTQYWQLLRGDGNELPLGERLQRLVFAGPQRDGRRRRRGRWADYDRHRRGSRVQHFLVGT